MPKAYPRSLPGGRNHPRATSRPRVQPSPPLNLPPALATPCLRPLTAPRLTPHRLFSDRPTPPPTLSHHRCCWHCRHFHVRHLAIHPRLSRPSATPPLKIPPSRCATCTMPCCCFRCFHCFRIFFIVDLSGVASTELFLAFASCQLCWFLDVAGLAMCSLGTTGASCVLTCAGATASSAQHC